MPQAPAVPDIIHEQGLHHQLTAGQMAMVAVGGSIGTGLLLGSAAALEVAGPGIIISYIIAAFIAYTVAMALGELASTHPAAGSFAVYGELYLNQYLGFLCRAAYWAAIAFSIGAELTASATYMGYWLPAVPGEVWVVVFSALLLLVNLRSVGSYGRFEFWFSLIKLATIIAFIVAGAALLFGGRVASQYTAQGGFLPKGPIAKRYSSRRAPHYFLAGRRVSRRNHRARRSDAVEPHRRLRKSLRQRAAPRPHSRSRLLHEFCSPDRRALRGQRQALRLLASAVLYGPHRLGSRKHGKIKRLRIAAPRAVSFFLWNRDRADHRKLGPKTSLRLHHGSCILRPYFLVGRMPRSPHQLPPQPHTATTRRSAHALPAGNLGIDRRRSSGLSHSNPYFFRNPHKRNRRDHLLRSTNRSLHLLKTPPPSRVEIYPV